MTRSVYCVDSNDYKISNERCVKDGEQRPQSHQICNNGGIILK